MNDMMQIVDTNPILFCRKLQEAVQDGYVIDDNSDFSMFWNLYTIGMKKVPKKALIESVFPAKTVQGEVLPETTFPLTEREDSLQKDVEQKEKNKAGRPVTKK